MGPPLSVSSRVKVTWSVAIALVALRLMIGWHFFSEGAEKFTEGFSAVGFLQSAKGPFAGAYHALLPDVDGLRRLNYDPDQEGWDRTDLSQTIGVWQFQLEQVAGYYGYGPGQRKLADQVLQRYQEELQNYFAANREEIHKYLSGIERRDANARRPERRDVPSLFAQSERIANELRKDGAPLLAEIDSMWIAYNAELNNLATDEQRERRGHQPHPLPRPGEANYVVAEVIGNDQYAIQPSGKLIDVELVNQIIPYFDLTIGILLVLGLFTRATAVLAALFLGSVFASQWPGTPGAGDVSYQMIEALALLVLAVTSAGRIAGLDYFLANLHRCRDELTSLFSQARQPAQEA